MTEVKILVEDAAAQSQVLDVYGTDAGDPLSSLHRGLCDVPCNQQSEWSQMPALPWFGYKIWP